MSEELLISSGGGSDMCRCPRCGGEIEQGLRVCGKCNAMIVWEGNTPKLYAHVLGQVGCALLGLGCLFPVLIGILVGMYLWLVR